MPIDHELYEAYRAARPKSAALFARAEKTLGGKSGHDLRHFAPMPIYVERGKRGRKWDIDGNEYVDFLLGNGALLLGHAPTEVLDAIASVSGQGTHFGNDHPLHIEWAERVQELVPSAERVRFVNSGTEATLLALRLARAFTSRSKILRFEGHFHGWHDDLVHGFQPPFDADGSLGIPAGVQDHTALVPDGDIEAVKAALDRDPDVAAVILEPSGASWGRVPVDPEFLRQLRDLTTRRDVLLIFDEVVTGFRYSPGGAQQLFNVLPDLSCFAKILTGGMPGGAVVGRADVMALFDQTGDSHHDRFERVVHLGTFNASPLTAAAGIALLKQVATGEPIAKANSVAEELRASFDSVLETRGIAGYVYGISSTFHVYFETDKDRVAKASTRADLKTRDAKRLKGMPADLIDEYQRNLRFHGVDIMSSTGGAVSSAHDERDIEKATDAFEKTVISLETHGLIHTIP